MPTLERAPTREFRNPIMDSRRWTPFEPRPDDIVIATYPKCGTTWTQRIIDLLVFQNTEARPVFSTSVWLDAQFFAPLDEDIATLEAQRHRRYIKSHLPFDSLPLYEGVKYIHVARDGRDAFMSWHNHVQGFTPQIKQRIGAIVAADPELMKGPPPFDPPEDPHLFFQGWIADAEGEPRVGPGENLSFFDFENTYWSERARANLLMVHYNDLKADLPGEMARISRFLDIDTPPQRLAMLAEAARFEHMKADGEALLPGIAEHFDHGPQRFLNKGTNGRWKDVLTAEDLARYDAVVQRKLSPACADWIEHGRLKVGDPRTAPD
jgi:aryl sulfotransferase